MSQLCDMYNIIIMYTCLHCIDWDFKDTCMFLLLTSFCSSMLDILFTPPSSPIHLALLYPGSFSFYTCSVCWCLVQHSLLQLGQTSTIQVATEMDGIMQEEFLKQSPFFSFCTKDMMKSVKCFSK